MTGLERTLITVVRFLDTHAIPYMIIGGIANLVWGVPRATLDVDVTIWVAEDDIPGFLAQVTRSFELQVPDPQGFVKETRVLPAKVREGFHVDFIFAQLPYEKVAIERAVVHQIHGVGVKVCSPEDLIIHKIISERPQDLNDVRGIIRQLGDRLDRDYLDPIVQGLSDYLERPEIWTHYLGCFG